LRLSTEEFRTVEASLGERCGSTEDEELMAAVEERHAEGHAIGWCLGVLAAASGTDLLLTRRERNGLSEMFRLVLVALGDRELSPSADELPSVAPDRGGGWELPFLLSWMLLRAGITPPNDGPLRWGLMEHDERQTFFLGCAPRREIHPLRALVRLVEGAEAIEEDDGIGVVLPAGSLLAPSPEGERGWPR